MRTNASPPAPLLSLSRSPTAPSRSRKTRPKVWTRTKTRRRTSTPPLRLAAAAIFAGVVVAVWPPRYQRQRQRQRQRRNFDREETWSSGAMTSGSASLSSPPLDAAPYVAMAEAAAAVAAADVEVEVEVETVVVASSKEESTRSTLSSPLSSPYFDFWLFSEDVSPAGAPAPPKALLSSLSSAVVQGDGRAAVTTLALASPSPKKEKATILPTTTMTDAAEERRKRRRRKRRTRTRTIAKEEVDRGGVENGARRKNRNQSGYRSRSKKGIDIGIGIGGSSGSENRRREGDRRLAATTAAPSLVRTRTGHHSANDIFERRSGDGAVTAGGGEGGKYAAARGRGDVFRSDSAAAAAAAVAASSSASASSSSSSSSSGIAVDNNGQDPHAVGGRAQTRPLQQRMASSSSSFSKEGSGKGGSGKGGSGAPSKTPATVKADSLPNARAHAPAPSPRRRMWYVPPDLDGPLCRGTAEGRAWFRDTCSRCRRSRRRHRIGRAQRVGAGSGNQYERENGDGNGNGNDVSQTTAADTDAKERRRRKKAARAAKTWRVCKSKIRDGTAPCAQKLWQWCFHPTPRGGKGKGGGKGGSTTIGRPPSPSPTPDCGEDLPLKEFYSTLDFELEILCPKDFAVENLNGTNSSVPLEGGEGAFGLGGTPIAADELGPDAKLALEAGLQSYLNSLSRCGESVRDDFDICGVDERVLSVTILEIEFAAICNATGGWESSFDIDDGDGTSGAEGGGDVADTGGKTRKLQRVRRQLRRTKVKANRRGICRRCSSGDLALPLPGRGRRSLVFDVEREAVSIAGPGWTENGVFTSASKASTMNGADGEVRRPVMAAPSRRGLQAPALPTSVAGNNGDDDDDDDDACPVDLAAEMRQVGFSGVTFGNITSIADMFCVPGAFDCDVGIGCCGALGCKCGPASASNCNVGTGSGNNLEQCYLEAPESLTGPFRYYSTEPDNLCCQVRNRVPPGFLYPDCSYRCGQLPEPRCSDQTYVVAIPDTNEGSNEQQVQIKADFDVIIICDDTLNGKKKIGDELLKYVNLIISFGGCDEFIEFDKVDVIQIAVPENCDVGNVGSGGNNGSNNAETGGNDGIGVCTLDGIAQGTTSISAVFFVTCKSEKVCLEKLPDEYLTFPNGSQRRLTVSSGDVVGNRFLQSDASCDCSSFLCQGLRFGFDNQGPQFDNIGSANVIGSEQEQLSFLPSLIPSVYPTQPPSGSPITASSFLPSDAISSIPTGLPSEYPSTNPSRIPTAFTTLNISDNPSWESTVSPSSRRSPAPSELLSNSPSSSSSSGSPSSNPTHTPTTAPLTASPDVSASALPSEIPSSSPMPNPSASPTMNPSTSPSDLPTSGSTLLPSLLPRAPPTAIPMVSATTEPSKSPFVLPSSSPSILPSSSPTILPSSSPSISLSSSPTILPSSSPIISPTESPTLSPSFYPTAGPTRPRCGVSDNCSANATCKERSSGVGFDCQCTADFYGDGIVCNPLSEIELTLSSPSHGEFFGTALKSLQRSSLIAVAGTVRMRPIIDVVLTINGLTLPIESDGTFFKRIPLDFDAVFNEVLAILTHIPSGRKFKDRVVAIAGDSLPMNGVVDDGIAARITEQGFDRLGPLLEVSLSGALNFENFLPRSNLLTGECLSEACAVKGDVIVTFSNVDEFQIGVDSTLNQVETDINLFGVTVNLRTDTNENDCEIEVTATSATISASYTVEPDALGNSIEPSQVDSTAVSLEGLRDRVVSDGCNFLNGYLGRIRNGVESRAKNTLKRSALIDGVVQEVMNQFEVVMVKFLAGFGLDATTQFFAVNEDINGVMLGANADLSGPEATACPANFDHALAISQQSPTEALAAIILTPGNRQFDMALSVTDSLLNQVMAFLIKEGCLLSIKVDEVDLLGNATAVDSSRLFSFLRESANLSTTSLRLLISPTLAPVFTGRPGPNGELAEIKLSHLLIDVVSMSDPTGELFARIAMDAVMAIDFVAGPTITADIKVKNIRDVRFTLLYNPYGIPEQSLRSNAINLVDLVASVIAVSFPSFVIPSFLGATKNVVEIARLGSLITFFMVFNSG